MKLLITGASGFLGRYVVKKALQENYQVRIVVRDINKLSQDNFSQEQNLEIVPGDLKKIDSFRDSLQGIDAVIHLAAVKTGTEQQQFTGTVETTENLLTAMKQNQVSRLILISSFSVYDYLQLDINQTLNENSPLEHHPHWRDTYAQTKLKQEQLSQAFQQNEHGHVTILRPGVLYKKDNLWNARLGVNLKSRLWLIINNQAQIPLNYVENCADAIIKACQQPEAINQIINLVDDNLPTQKEYLNQILETMTSKPYLIFFSYRFISLFSQLIWLVNQKIFQGRLKIPGILIPARLQARFKPLQYHNYKAKQILNWQPKYSLSEVLKRI